jgi:hypothetical protein
MFLVQSGWPGARVCVVPVCCMSEAAPVALVARHLHDPQCITPPLTTTPHYHIPTLCHLHNSQCITPPPTTTALFHTPPHCITSPVPPLPPFHTQVASMVSKVSQLSTTNQIVRRRLRVESAQPTKEEEAQLRCAPAHLLSVLTVAQHNLRRYRPTGLRVPASVCVLRTSSLASGLLASQTYTSSNLSAIELV